MSQRNVKAGGAFIELAVKDEKFRKGLDDAAARMKRFGQIMGSIGSSLAAVGTSIAGIGTAVLGGLGGAAKVFADTGSAIADMSARTGVAAGQLSELKYAAEQGGASAADLETALRNMAKKGLDPSQFDAYAAKIAAIEDPVERVQAALELFGKSGTKLLPVLGQIDALRGEARGLGLTIDPKTAAQADALGDSMDNLGKVTKDFVFEIGAAVAGPLTDLTNFMTQAVAAASSFIQQNQGIVTAVVAVGAVAVAAGTAIAAMGGAFLVVSAAMAGIAAIGTALATTAGIVVVALSGIVGLLAIATGAWATFTAAGQAALGETMKFITGILNALASGNLSNAMQQLATQFQIIWTAAMNGIYKVFVRGIDALVQMLVQQIRKVNGILIATDFTLKLKGAKTSGLESTIALLSEAGATLSTTSTLAANAAIGQAEMKLKGLQVLQDSLRAAVEPPKAIDASKIKLPNLADLLTGIDVNAEAVQRGGGSVGTFNSSAAGMLGRAGGPMDRTAKAAEKGLDIQEKIKKLLEDIDDGIEGLEGFSLT